MATQKQKEHAWETASPVKGKNPELYRKDNYGNEIYKPSYGKQGEKSWEVDHKKPVAKGGTESLRNIQALKTSVNREKSHKYPHK